MLSNEQTAKEFNEIDVYTIYFQVFQFRIALLYACIYRSVHFLTIVLI